MAIARSTRLCKAVATAVLLCAPTVVAAAEDIDDDSFCMLSEPGFPTIDLRRLALSGQDYAVTSHVNDQFDYVINICGQLSYQDDTCHAGSAVCERHRRSDLATTVLGYLGSTALAWHHPDGAYTRNSSVRLAMTGEKCKANNNLTDASTVIHFMCSNKEFLVLQSEKPAACQLELLFFTAQACGTPRYTCFNGTKCVESNDNFGKYATYDSCVAECGVQPPRYSCIEDKAYGFQCAEDRQGRFGSFDGCTNACSAAAENHVGKSTV